MKLISVLSVVLIVIFVLSFAWPFLAFVLVALAVKAIIGISPDSE